MSRPATGDGYDASRVTLAQFTAALRARQLPAALALLGVALEIITGRSQDAQIRQAAEACDPGLSPRPFNLTDAEVRYIAEHACAAAFGKPGAT